MRRLFLRLALLSVLSIGRLPGQRQPARRHRVGEFFPELLGLGGAPESRHSHRLEGDYLPVANAPLPQPSGPGAVQGQRAALVEEAVMQVGSILLALRQEQERVLLESRTRPVSYTRVRASRRTRAGGRSSSSSCPPFRTEPCTSGSRRSGPTPSAPLMMCAVSGGCLRREAQIALSAVWEPTIETNQRPSFFSSRAKSVHCGAESSRRDRVKNLPRTSMRGHRDLRCVSRAW